MRDKALLNVLIILIACSSIKAQEWSKYVPEKQRKDVFKKVSRIQGTGISGAISGKTGMVVWVTEPVARVMVSNLIDLERIDSQEAEKIFQALRPESHFTFLFFTLSPPNAPGSTRTSNADDPLQRREIFLQRAENHKIFSKGESPKEDIDLGSKGFINRFQTGTEMIIFQKTTRDKQLLVQSLDDRLEVQFNLGGKIMVFEYKLKDIVSRLEDL